MRIPRLRFVVAILVVCAFAASAQDAGQPQIDVSVDEVLADFDVVWQAVADFYVDEGFGGVDWQAIQGSYRTRVSEAEDAAAAYNILAEMVAELGNDLTYVIPPWLRPTQPDEPQQEERVELEYAGVGILLQQMQNGEVWVLQVFRQTPAEKSGVLLGDVVVGVNDWRVAGENPVAEISSRVRGPVGTDVTLVLRDPDGNERRVAITRARIDLRPSVEFRTIEGTIGYLRIPALTQELVAEASKALPRLLSTRLLILDLRNVSVGGLEAMIQVAQWFIGSAHLGGFVSRDGAVALPYREDSISAYQRPIAMLVNSGTSGIGEIMAAILHDYKRGRIVGVQTQGGFHIGQTIDLPSGGALNMTVGLYITPLGEILPIYGLTPDNEVELPDLATIRSGRDVFIEKAVEVLRNNPRL